MGYSIYQYFKECFLLHNLPSNFYVVQILIIFHTNVPNLHINVVRKTKHKTSLKPRTNKYVCRRGLNVCFHNEFICFMDMCQE